jgi:hypothetical protein
MHAEVIIGAMTMIIQMDQWQHKHPQCVDGQSQHSSSIASRSRISHVSLSAARVLLDTSLDFSQIVYSKGQTSQARHNLNIYGITFWPHAGFFTLYQHITQHHAVSSQHEPPDITTTTDSPPTGGARECQEREDELEKDAARLTNIAALLSDAARTKPQYKASAEALTKLSSSCQAWCAAARQQSSSSPESKLENETGVEGRSHAQIEISPGRPAVGVDQRQGFPSQPGLELGLIGWDQTFPFGIPSAASASTSASFSASASGLGSSTEPWGSFHQGYEAMDLGEFGLDQSIVPFGTHSEDTMQWQQQQQQQQQQEIATDVQGWDWGDVWTMQ